MAPTASTSSSSAALHLPSVRRATYNKTRKGANKGLNWPYPLTAAAARNSSIHPDRLVEAGFYCTPTLDDPTVTTCFLCEIVIGQWEEGEDPLYRHQAAIDEAEIRCGWLDVLNQSWTRDGADGGGGGGGGGVANVPRDTWPALWSRGGMQMHPRGERMAWARLATFRLGWPHEGAQGVPTKEEIAAAGWVFRPGAEEESQDQCACIYCGRTVEGWEEGDDPVALHKRKIGLKCPFFLADDLPVVQTGSASAEQKAALQAEEVAAEEEEGEEEEEEPVKPKRGSRKTTAGPEATAPKKSTRGAAASKTKSKGGTKLVREEEDPVEEADAGAAPGEEQGAEEEVVAVNDEASESEPVKPARKAKAVNSSSSSSAPTKAKKAARQTTTRSTRARTTPAVSDAEDAPEQADMSVLRKSTRARAASNASTTSSVIPTRTAAAAATLSKSTRSRAAQVAPGFEASTAEVPDRSTVSATAPTVAESSAPGGVKPPKRSASTKASRKLLEVESSPAEAATADADESIAQLARIADAALEAQGPEEIGARDPAPPPPLEGSKKNKKALPDAGAGAGAGAGADASASSSGSGSAPGTTKPKKGKKAATAAAQASSAEGESASGTATPQEASEAMVVEVPDEADPLLSERPADSNPAETAPPGSKNVSAPALVASAAPQPPTYARSPLSPTSPGTSSSRPIRALPVNKSSKSPSTGSLQGLSVPASEAAQAVPSPSAPLPTALPSQSSSQSSLPTSTFETASERFSTGTRVDPNAPFVAPANPFAGSTLLSLVPPPTPHELDSLTVAEWFSLCHSRIADRFAAENAAMRAHFEARLEAGRTKLRGMCDEAREREEREAREEDENRRAVAKERRDRVAASGGSGRHAVKAGGGSTRKMR